jgi:4-amino-4-deoxy-L-arabinose transferase-like glycosyltransferase
VLSVYYLVYSRAAVTDMTLALFISLSLFSFYRSTTEDSPGNRMHLYGFYLFSALAFLTKGLIGIIFPFGIALIFMAVTRGTGGMKKVFSLRGFLLFTALAAPWYLAQVMLNGREFIDQFLIKHHFQRYTDVISGHRGPAYYYLIVIIIGLFPWISFLPSGIRHALKEKNRLHLFAFVWFAFVFLFFSLSTTKLPNYILPALPAASVLIGAGMSEQDKNWRRYSFLSMGILSVLMGIAFFIARIYLPTFAAADGGWTLVTAAITLVSGALCLYSAFSKDDLYGLISVLMTVFLAVLLMRALPLASDYLQGTLHKYSLYAKERLREDEGVIVFGINNPSIAFYSERKIISANSKGDLQSLSEKGGRAVAISKAGDAGLLRDLGYNLIECDTRYAIFEKK